jgi:FkbM family methyltransferase
MLAMARTIGRNALPLALRVFARELLSLGIRPAITLFFDRSLGRFARKRGWRKAGSLRLRNSPHPFHFRHYTSDSLVLRQVLTGREYACPIASADPRLILDLGANIGCASVWFLTRYPNAHVIAVEPDSGNFAVLRRNLEPYRERVTLVQGAVWPTDGPLRVVRETRNGLEWSYQVRPCAEGESSDVEGFSIGRLLSRAPQPRVDILKIDVEGAELKLFSAPSNPWLDAVDNIFIELHGPDCDQTFSRAMSGYRYDRSQSGELAICRNIHKTGDSHAS